MFEKARYTNSLRRLHWLMAILIALAYLYIEQRGMFVRGSPERRGMLEMHYWLGISIFILACIRLQQRLKYGVPRITPALPSWQNALSLLFHIALYAFLIMMPILGFLTANFDGKIIYIPFTEIPIPPVVRENEGLAEQFEGWHHDIGEAFYWVFGLHIAAALYHHFVRKDDTLTRMR